METSPLLRLPLELREAIYHFTLYYPHGVVINLNGQEAHAPSLEPNSQPKQQHAAALTATCKQIRHECNTLFYSLNTFHLHPLPKKGGTSRSIGPWLQSLSATNAAALRHINIDIGTWTPSPTRHAPAVSASTNLRPVPGQVAGYLICFAKLRCTFTLRVQYSDIPELGAFGLEEVDLRREEREYGTLGSEVERALVAQAERIRCADVRGEVQGFAVVALMMGLERCRRGLGEFLAQVVERVRSEEEWGGLPFRTGRGDG